jgi:hypothetical protein
VLTLLPITTWTALGYIVARHSAHKWPFRPRARLAPQRLEPPPSAEAAVRGPDGPDQPWPPPLGPNLKRTRKPGGGISGRLPKQSPSEDREREPDSDQPLEHSNAASATGQ